MLTRVILAAPRYPRGSISVSRALSESAAKSDVSASAESTENPVGRYYHDLVYRGRGHHALALGDLRRLLQMCNTPELARYGLHGVDLYQRKGQDFSEEVNSHFIRSVAVEGKQAVNVAKVIAVWKNRIGAWGTTTSLQRLMQGLLDQAPSAADGADGEGSIAELAITVLEVSQKKGVSMTKPVFELAMNLIPDDKGSAEADAGADAGAEAEAETGEEKAVEDVSGGEDGDAAEGGESAAASDNSVLRARLQQVAVLALGEGEASSLRL